MPYRIVLSTFLLIPIVLASPNVLEDTKSAEEDAGSSLVFVFDTTGSMHDDLKQLSEGAEMILDTALEESNAISNFVFVPFHDPAVGPATVTRSKSEFKAALSRIRVRGGGDCPERALGGLRLALAAARPRSSVYLLTDASAADHHLLPDVLDDVQRKQAQIVFVLTGHCNDLDQPHYKVYQRIAAASSGQVFNLNKTSVHNVLDFVRNSLKGRMVNLGSVVNPAGYNFTKEIPVDNSLSEVTVSVSGSKPSIRVIDPSGQQLTGPPKLVTRLDLSEIMAVTVLQPEPGNWSITVGSEEDYSVKVSGQSNLTFRHGFSVHRPGSAAETSHRPLQGTLNYMLISLTEERPVKIDFAEILTLEGKTLFEVPLKQADGEGKFVLAEPFMPPDDLFYIAINGRDENNQELRRVGATAVQAKLPDPPYMTAAQSVAGRLHDTLTLSCRVESLVPVTVTWTKDGQRQTASTLQSTVLEFVIQDLNEDTAGTYRCVAKNQAGVSTATTEVQLIVDPPSVSLSPRSAAAAAGQRVQLSCVVRSRAALQHVRLAAPGLAAGAVTEIPIEEMSDGYFTYNSTVEVSENSTGVYTCMAANKGGEASSAMQITVLTLPKVEILGSHTLTADVHTSVQLLCDVEYTDTVRWLAPNGSEVKSQHVFGRELSDLLIKVSLSDEGNWTCLGVGRTGFEARDSIYLNVTIRPLVEIEGTNNVTLFYGSSSSIVCNVQARPRPEKLSWSKNNGQMLNTTVLSQQLNLYTTTLVLTNITEASEGIYVCYAENGSGSAREAVKVNVRKNMTLLEGFTDQSVNLYSELKLNCKVDSYPKTAINWYHNGTKLLPTENVLLLAENTTVLIKKVNFSQLGHYVCEATNGYEQIVLNGTITVTDLESPVLFKEPRMIIARRGNSTVVTCRILKGKPEPAITWRFQTESSNELSHLPGGCTLSQDQLQLHIDTVDMQHAGSYRCAAENDFGMDVYESLLVVQYPPQFTIEQVENQNGTLEVIAGETVTFSCKATGVPPPLVVWSKDGKPITFTKNIYLSSAHSLVVLRASPPDSGQFSCTAASPLGAAHRNFTLFVFEPPTISLPQAGPELHVVEGQLVELPCVARGTPPPARHWRRWRRGAAPLSADRMHMDEDFVLRFVANLTDFGEYTCVAMNRYGNASYTYSIYVWVPPYIEPPLDMEVETVVGRNVSLNCNAIGFPIPTIVWEFEQQPLIVNTTDLSYNDVGDVFIRNASARHSGVFTCIAENDVGAAVKSILLNVNEPPMIQPDKFTGPYVATSMDVSLTLPCAATGKPAPFLAWSRDGVYIDNDERYDISTDGSLTLKWPAEELSGLYVCEARNRAGRASSSREVHIYSLPTLMQADQPQSTVTVLEGSNYTLECPVRVTGNYTVKWYKDGSLLRSSSLGRVSRRHGAVYACSVRNAVGAAQAAVALSVHWPPAFLRRPAAAVAVLKGQDHVFDCAIDAEPEAQTKWLFNSQPIGGEDKDHLRLANVQLHQTGVYKCIVSNKHGTVVRQFTLDVLVPPFISHFDFLEVQFKEGDNATLGCEAVGSPTPTITWSHNNTNWHQQSDSLHIYNASIESQGVFRCDARSKAGDTHLVYRVTVVAPARVTEVVVYDGSKGITVLGTVELLLNTTTRIACHATGNPTPRIQWFKNGNYLSENAPGITYADLVFDPVQSVQAKLYICVVSNDGGSDEKRIQVKVLEPPQISTSMFQARTANKTKSLEVLSGQPFHLHCHAYGEPPPQILWYKDGGQLKLVEDDVEMKIAEFGEVLMVNKAVYELSGNYTCVARNKVGERSFSYLVNVLVPPSAAAGPSPLRLRQGSRLQLRCPALGRPAARVHWARRPALDEDGWPRLHLSEDNATLTINSTQISDSGIYTCTLMNKVGVAEISYSVSVESAPSSGQETSVTSLHGSVVLYCRADGHPPPSVYWYKDGEPLQPDSDVQPVLAGHVLAVWRVRARHAGRYRCLAHNSAGRGQRRIHLRVTVPGAWSPWSTWSLCNVTCGLGHQVRSRDCRYSDDDVTVRAADNSSWILDESSCRGAALERRKCHLPACEEAESRAHWANWSPWSPCSGSCGVGAQTRSRRCRPAAAQCTGDNVQIRKCPDLPPCNSTIVGESENDVLNNSREELTEPNLYMPEATFELEPEVGPSYPEGNPSNPEVEEFDVTGTKSSKFFDVPLTENLNATEDGTCGVGYKYNNNIEACEDIDECLAENNHCHSTQLCENTAGAYRCGCQPGYEALGVGQRCLDVNECSRGTDGCEYACVNVAGGYVCACPRALRLHADRRRCLPAATNGEQLDMEQKQDYLSAKFEFPARFAKHSRN